MDRSTVRLVAAALVLTLPVWLEACGSDETVEPFQPRPASLAELTGPWRETPMVLDPLLWARAEDACRKDMQMAPGTRALIVDARGAGVLTLRMTGASMGGCNSLQLMPNGQVTGAGGGWSGAGPERIEPIHGAKLGSVEQQNVGGGDLAITGWSISGQAGDEIAAVVVEPRGRQPVRATLMNGWFAAWWPAMPGEPDPLMGGLWPDGSPWPRVVVRGYDAAGVQLDELRQ